MEFPRQEYWSGLPLPTPGDLPDTGIDSTSPALTGGFFTTVPPAFGSPKATREAMNNIQRTSHRAISGFFSRNSASQREWRDVFKCIWWKGKTYNQEYSARLLLRFDGEIKSSTEWIFKDSEKSPGSGRDKKNLFSVGKKAWAGVQKCLNQRNEEGQRGGRTMWLNQLKAIRHPSGVREGRGSSSHF